MDEAKLRALLDSDEDEHIEFKKAESAFDFDKLVDYCVALANEKGGFLILGVTDKKPRIIVGTKAYLDGLVKIKEHLTSQVQLRIEIEEVQCREGRVLVFSIPSRPLGVPKRGHGKYLMRAGEALVVMSDDQVKRIFDEAGPDFSAEICPGAIMTDLDGDSIEEFRRRWATKANNPAIAGLPREQLLSDAELVVGGKITYSALVLFGKREALGRLLGQAEVIFEYRANDATGPAQQRLEFRQGFFSFYDKLWETIDLRNTNQHYQDGLFIWDIKTFNEGATREAILNAVSHRDYRSGASVFVRQYPERIEITNPGGPPPGIDLENILWEQMPRNRRLADAFARCGLVERSGQGMNRIFESCIRESKGDPDFTHTDADHFWITLRGTIQHPEFLRVLQKIGGERLLSFSLDDFIVIQAVFEDRPISPRFAACIKRLLEEGLLEKTSSRGTSAPILSRRLYKAIGKEGVHTRKKGLDRGYNKQLLFRHIELSEPAGAKMEELLQVLPSFNRHLIRPLLSSLQKEGKIHVAGTTKAARWHLGSGAE
jgi:ATP-dependent DNA helicase RecG